MRRVVYSSQQITNVRLSPPGRRRAAVARGRAPRRDAGRSRTRGHDRRSRHAPGGRVPRRLGRRARWERSKISSRPTPTRARAIWRGSRRPSSRRCSRRWTSRSPVARGDGADLFSPTGREIWHDLAVSLAAALDSRIPVRDLGRPFPVSQLLHRKHHEQILANTPGHRAVVARRGRPAATRGSSSRRLPRGAGAVAMSWRRS